MRRTLLIVSVCLALPAAAQAGALPPPSFTVGGGGLDGKQAAQGRIVSLRVGGDGRTLRVSGFMTVPCRKPYTMSREFTGRTRIADDGSFTGSFRTANPDRVFAQGRARVLLSGTFDGVQASGTVRYAKGAYAVGPRGHRACSTAEQPFMARDPGRPSGSSRTIVPDQTQFGLTSDVGHGVRLGAVIRFGRDRIFSVFAGLRFRCGREKTIPANYSPPIDIDQRGRFRRREHFTLRYSNARSRYTVTTSGHLAEGGGVAGRVTASIRTRFTRGRSKGLVERCPHAADATFATIP